MEFNDRFFFEIQSYFLAGIKSKGFMEINNKLRLFFQIQLYNLTGIKRTIMKEIQWQKKIIFFLNSIMFSCRDQEKGINGIQ